MLEELSTLMTEQQNLNSLHIDEMNTMDMLRTINREDQKVALAIEKELDAITRAVDRIYERVSQGGRLIYIGAGTSGRLGVLDASECPPTYGVSPDLVMGLIAGGKEALQNAIEGAEDDPQQAQEDLKQVSLTSLDVVCGLAASGRTPYVIGGLMYAQSIGALTVSVCCVENGMISRHADVPIEVKVGPEVITGSTRMKSGSAQKMVLNMLSTAVMIKMGKVYGNLMIDVQPTNEKLKERAVSIVAKCADITQEEAREQLESCEYDVKCAIIMKKTDMDIKECQDLLQQHQNQVAKVIRTYQEKL